MGWDGMGGGGTCSIVAMVSCSMCVIGNITETCPGIEDRWRRPGDNNAWKRRYATLPPITLLDLDGEIPRVSFHPVPISMQQ